MDDAKTEDVVPKAWTNGIVATMDAEDYRRLVRDNQELRQLIGLWKAVVEELMEEKRQRGER